MSKLSVILGGLTLPDQVQLIDTSTDNAVDVRGLDGTLWTDFTDGYYTRSWTVAFDTLPIATWNSIMALYRGQFENETYLIFVVAALGINTTVRLTISPAYYQWNGNQVGDGTQSNYPTLTLQEAVAIS